MSRNPQENPRPGQERHLTQDQVRFRVREIGVGNYGTEPSRMNHWKSVERGLANDGEAQERFYRCSRIAAEIMYVQPDNLNAQQARAWRGQRVTSLLGEMSELAGTRRYFSITQVAEAAERGDRKARILAELLDIVMNRAADQMVQTGDMPRKWEHFVEKAIGREMRPGPRLQGQEQPVRQAQTGRQEQAVRTPRVGEDALVVEMREQNRLMRQILEQQGAGGGGRISPEEQARRKGERDKFYNDIWWAFNPSGSGGDLITPEWMKEAPDSIKVISRLGNAAVGKKRNGANNLDSMLERGKEGKGPQFSGVFMANNAEMALLFEEHQGLEKAGMIFLQTFFEPTTKDGKFALRFKQGPEGDRLKALLGDPSKFREEIVGRVMRAGIAGGATDKERESNALELATVAMCLVQVGHVFEYQLDGEMTSFSSKAMVGFMYPEKMMMGKVDSGESTDSPVQKWALKMKKVSETSLNPLLRGEAAEVIRSWKKGEIHLFPDNLLRDFYSSTEYEVATPTGRRKMSMLEAMYYGYKVDFGSHSKGLGHEVWGEYLGTANDARKIFDIATGKTHWEGKDYSGFRDDLAGVLQGLVEKGYKITPETIKWLLANYALIENQHNSRTFRIKNPGKDEDIFIGSAVGGVLKDQLDELYGKGTADRIKNAFLRNKGKGWEIK